MYFLYFINGEVNLPLAAAGPADERVHHSAYSNIFMYIVAAIIFIYAVVVMVYTFRKHHED